jgi:mRNA interferase HigB
VNVIAKRTLVQFWARHPQARGPLSAWYAIASHAEWRSPQDVKEVFGSNVDFIADNRLIFDIAGNKYRLIVRMSYEFKSVLIKFVGTHADYDRINPESV